MWFCKRHILSNPYVYFQVKQTLPHWQGVYFGWYNADVDILRSMHMIVLLCVCAAVGNSFSIPDSSSRVIHWWMGCSLLYWCMWSVLMQGKRTRLKERERERERWLSCAASANFILSLSRCFLHFQSVCINPLLSRRVSHSVDSVSICICSILTNIIALTNMTQCLQAQHMLNRATFSRLLDYRLSAESWVCEKVCVSVCLCVGVFCTSLSGTDL